MGPDPFRGASRAPHAPIERMSQPLAPGDAVQTPFGKGVVREARGSDRYLVDVSSKHFVIAGAQLAPLTARQQRRAAIDAPPAVRRVAASEGGLPASSTAAREIDLHGLTVAEALGVATQAISDAIVAAHGELRLIHGRSGGRIKAALHAQLRSIAAVRGVRIDPRNAGVTIVSL